MTERITGTVACRKNGRPGSLKRVWSRVRKRGASSAPLHQPSPSTRPLSRLYAPVQQFMVLLGGDAGLRMGEMIALEWSDVDLKRGLLKVQRSDWKGHVTLPKGGRPREVPLTRALASALVRNRHLRGERVLYREDGTPVSQQTVRSWMAAAQKRAGLKVTRGRFTSSATRSVATSPCEARPAALHQGTGGPPEPPPHHDVVHAPGEGREAPRHPDAGGGAGRVSGVETFWRRAGA